MRRMLYMAWRYLNYYRIRSLILILALTSLFYLPLALRMVIRISEDFLRSRSEQTPLVLGARGSEMDLVLGALYFKRSATEGPIWADMEEIRLRNMGEAVPLHYMFSARDFPVVGTSPAYFSRRDLIPAEGELPLMLGECVLGSAAAAELELTVGDTIVSDPENPYSLAGYYPLELRVTGILAPSRSWDDRAVFTDIKTAWVIQGLGHGHMDLNTESRIASSNASLYLYNRVDPEQIKSFHFHGDRSGFPLSAVLVFPDDPRSEALLLADWEEKDSELCEPDKVILRLLDTLFRIRDILGWVMALALTVTAATVVFILALTVRMRRRESLTLHKIGGSASLTLMLTGLEMLILSLISLSAALLLLRATSLGRNLFLAYLIR